MAAPGRYRSSHSRVRIKPQARHGRGDLRVDLPNRKADDPGPIPEERPSGPVRADHQVLVAVEDEHSGRQFGHCPSESDRVGRSHVGDRLAREFLEHGRSG
jgi:hypothetical protein